MPQIINTNLASINAQRNLDKSQQANQTALQRLSSGLRINSAKDDAAGLAISTRFTAQIKGLNVAVRNAGDGIALAQTAEGALSTVNDNLQRIRELAAQSANATNADVDRQALQAEVKQLVAEITRTTEEADFNGRKLLDGSFSATFQVGANAGQTIDVNIEALTADKLGSSAQAGVSARGIGSELKNGDLIINGQDIRATNSSDDNLSFKDNAMSGIAKAAAINASSDKTGVSATVNENVVVGNKMDATSAAGGATVYINGVEVKLQGTDNADEVARSGTRNSVVAAINSYSERTGVTAEDGGEAGGVILKAADGRNITLSVAANGAAGMDLKAFGLGDGTADPFTHYAGFTLTSANANTSINIKGGDGTGGGDIANSGLAAGTYTAHTAATSSTANTVNVNGTGGPAALEAAQLKDGDLVINGVTISGASGTSDTASSKGGAASAIATAAAINKASGDTGVKATVNANQVVGKMDAAATAAAADMTLKLNGVEITVAGTGDVEKNKANAIAAINEIVGQTGITAIDNGVSITLEAADGRNIHLETVTNAGGFGLNGFTADDVYIGTVTLESAAGFEISVGSNGKEGLDKIGLVGGTFGGGQDGQSLQDVDISTFEGAQKALVAIDNALASVASQRADLGAIQNRMESTVSNLKVTAENLQAANSRILDADFAAETAEMARTQILQQAGISVLAQANASGQNVLSLLG